MLLAGLVRAKFNVIVSGATGTGKTTLLNALSGLIPDGERIITIEDSAELQLQQSHVIRLESRPPNVEGKGQITIRDLVRNSLRMRPDRIIVGEVRGGETLDMLQAMSTGHDGSLATVHANSAEDALMRLQTLASMSEVEIPFEALQDQINSAVDVHRPAHPARRRLPPDHRDRPPRLARPRDVPDRHGLPLRRPARWAPTASCTASSRYFPLPRRVAERLYMASEPHAARLRRRRVRRQLATREATDERPVDRRDDAPGRTPTMPTLLAARRHPAVRRARRRRRARLRRRAAPSARPSSTGSPARRGRARAAGRRAPLPGRRPPAARHPPRPPPRTAAGRHRPGPHPRRVLRLHARRASLALWLIAAGRPRPVLRPDRRRWSASGRAIAFLNWQRPEAHRGVHQPAPRAVPHPRQRHPGRPRPAHGPRHGGGGAGGPGGRGTGQGRRPAGRRPLHRRRARRAGRTAARPANWSSSSPPWSCPTGRAAPVVSSLRNLTETLEERKETRREVRTQLSQVERHRLAVPLLGLGVAAADELRSTPGALDRMTGSSLGQARGRRRLRPVRGSASSSSAACPRSTSEDGGDTT